MFMFFFWVCLLQKSLRTFNPGTAERERERDRCFLSSRHSGIVSRRHIFKNCCNVRRRRGMQFFLLAPQKEAQDWERGERKIFFVSLPTGFEANVSSHIPSSFLILYANVKHILFFKWIDGKNGKQTFVSLYFRSGIFPAFFMRQKEDERRSREASTIKTRHLHPGSINIYEFTFFRANKRL